jgi:hypothetical protein
VLFFLQGAGVLPPPPPRLNAIFVLSFISRDLPKIHLPSLHSVVGS